MKAKIPLSPSTELSIPSWMPEPVARRIKAGKYIPQYCWPLICDPRMRGVWQEVRRQPTRPSSKASPKARQDAALIEIFDTALDCMQRYTATMTRKQVKRARDSLIDQADQLEFEAMSLSSSPWAERLMAAASICRDYANERYEADIATASERQLDGQAHWTALTISNAFQRLFGKSMYT
jgi:hypothetical protein